jgi:hypothetical protein
VDDPHQRVDDPKPNVSPLSRISGVCAVLYTAALIVGFFMLAGIGLLDAERATDALTILVRHRTTAIVAGWVFVVGPVLLAVAGLGLFAALRQAGSLVSVAALTFIGGALLALIRNCIWLAIAYELAPAYANATEDVQAILATVGDMLIRFGFIAGDLMGGILVAGIGVPLFSAAILRTRRAPGWIAWLGFAIALTAGWFTLLIPVADAFGIITFVGFAGFWVWMVALGVALWRSPQLDGR